MYTRARLESLLEREVHDTERPWSVKEIDWLFPIRKLAVMGFTHLEELKVEVKYRRYVLDMYRASLNEMTMWVESAIAGMEVAAKTCKVEFTDDTNSRF